MLLSWALQKSWHIWVFTRAQRNHFGYSITNSTNETNEEQTKCAEQIQINTVRQWFKILFGYETDEICAKHWSWTTRWKYYWNEFNWICAWFWRRPIYMSVSFHLSDLREEYAGVVRVLLEIKQHYYAYQRSSHRRRSRNVNSRSKYSYKCDMLVSKNTV